MSLKIGRLGLGDLGGGRGEQPGARLAVSAHEALGHVGAEPFAGRGEAGECARPAGICQRSDDVADTVMLQLLRAGALQVHVVALALAERRDHLLGGADVDQRQRLQVHALLEAGVLEHGHRLAAVVDDHLLALELVPAEGLVGAASGEEEAVLLVDLGEMHDRRLLALLERREACAGADWADMDRAIGRPAIADLPGAETECLGVRPSCFRKPPAKVAISGE